MIIKIVPILLFFTLIAPKLDAQTIANPLLAPIGGPTFTNWAGLRHSSGSAALVIPGKAIFEYPQGPKGWYVVGFLNLNDGTRDWRPYYGIQLDILTPVNRPFELQTTLMTPPTALRQDYIAETSAKVVVVPGSWQRVTLPWSAFDFDKSQTAMLKFVQRVALTGSLVDGKAGIVHVRNIHLTMAPEISLSADVCGKAGQPGSSVNYDVMVGNCTDRPVSVALSFVRNAWQAMPATVSPSQLFLAPGASKLVEVAVAIPAGDIPPGGHETEVLEALIAGSSASPTTLEFITARDVERPSILMTPEGWANIRQNVQRYDWAQKAQAVFTAAADKWQVPNDALPPNNYDVANQHVYTFPEHNFADAYSTAVAWQLTRNQVYAQKVALFLTRFAAPKHGYPANDAATDMGGPQEGADFQDIAICYDAILDAGILSDSDKQSIDRALRLYMSNFEEDLTVGNVGNWSVAQSTGCLFCALAIGDLSAVNRYIYGPCGFTDFVGKGIMDDGWWWECSTGYNMWTASELTQDALACQPWGIDLLNLAVPANFSPNTIVTPWALAPPYGVNFEKWGPNHRNTRTIKQLWDAVVSATDYRGMVFGMNDGHNEIAGGTRMELAYYAFRDPAYATLIKLGTGRDLIYGVPDLPSDPATPYLDSGYAENIGYSLLRSQTTGRDPEDQIQAVLKTGTQGGFHGHFDRVSLDNVERYGRSFYSPESVWWGYPNYLYKFYVQTSDASNMVVVDQKQQEAVPSSQLMFYSGKMMQAAAVETNARWSDPPYGGMQYFPGDTFAGQMRKNEQSIPPVNDRKYGELGPFSDRVLQRRLAVVTDDYIVIADYLKSTDTHTFDNLFQMKGFTGIDGSGIQLVRHDPQFSADPHSSAQFVTDCDWYEATAPAIGHFATVVGKTVAPGSGHEENNADGPLKMDIRTLWPSTQQIMVGTPPLPQGMNQWVSYSVDGDGKQLAQGESGMWILGAQSIDVPVTGVSALTLQVTSDGVKNSLFWANARIVTASGTELPVGTLTSARNVAMPPAAGEDYYGGPIKIDGVPYAQAIAAQPASGKEPAVITVSLAGLNAVRFKATLGADYPLGDESALRKVYAIRSVGTTARFLTVLEPYEDQPMIKSAVATDASTLQVQLTDGRVQDITISNLDGNGQNIGVTITESRNGQVIRSEATHKDFM